MAYSSNLTDKEWEIIETLLPKKKQTRPTKWTKRQILDGIFYQLKNGCNWSDLLKDLPPYSTVFWHYKQWRAEGIIEKLCDIYFAWESPSAGKKKAKLTSLIIPLLSLSEKKE